MLPDQLDRLKALHEQGELSDREYAAAKARLIDEGDGAKSNPLNLDRNTYALIMHLSQFAHLVFPLGGIVAPLVLWLIARERDPYLDEHGKSVMNWVISELIYALGAGLLSIVLIGIPLLVALVVVGIVFPIQAAIAASNGRHYRYPFAIGFFEPAAVDPQVQA